MYIHNTYIAQEEGLGDLRQIFKCKDFKCNRGSLKPNYVFKEEIYEKGQQIISAHFPFK